MLALFRDLGRCPFATPLPAWRSRAMPCVALARARREGMTAMHSESLLALEAHTPGTKLAH